MSLPVFPTLTTMEWNSVKKQRWNTKVQTSGSGIRKTMAAWAYPQWEIKAAYRALSTAEYKTLAGFCAQVKGSFAPFLWLDPEDYQETGVRIGIGSGASKSFQLLRNFDNRFVEPVRDIVAGTLHVYEAGVEKTVTLGSDGIVTFSPANGAIITATFQYYWRVAFKDDDLDWEYFWYSLYRLKTLEMVTVL